MASSIGRLNVMIGASATEFQKVTADVEKKLVGLTTKALSFPKSFMGGFNNISSGFTSSADMLMKSADALLNFVPGGKLASISLGLAEGVEGIAESGKRGLESMRELRREAKRFDVSPEFLRAFKLTGGPDAEMAVFAVDKIVDALGKLRNGDAEFSNALRPFIDIQKLAKDNPEEAILRIADAYKVLDGQVKRMDFAGRIFGDKKADDLHYFFAGGAEEILSNISKVRGHRLIDETALRVSDVGAETKRAIALIKEQRDAENAVHEAARMILEKKYETGVIKDWFSYQAALGHVGPWGTPGFSKELVDQYLQTLKDQASQRPLEPSGRAGFLTGAAANAMVPEATTKAQRDFISGLERQVTMLGMSARQAAEYQAKIMGLTAAQQAYAGALAERKELNAQGSSLFDETRTDAEKTEMRIRKLTGLMDAGEISAETFRRALRKMAVDLNTPAAALPQLRVAGSQAAFDLIDQQPAKGDGTEKVIGVLKGIGDDVANAIKPFIESAIRDLKKQDQPVMVNF